MDKRDKIFISILISVLLHFFLLGLGAYFSILSPPRSETPESLEVTLLKGKPYQIADIAPPEKEEKPEQAKFLGMYDSRVKEETVSKTTGPSSHAPAKTPSHKEVSEHPERFERPKDEGIKLAAKHPEEKRAEEEPVTDGEDYFTALSDDFFPDYKVGDRTYLNVFKYPKIGYFVRMKKVFRTTFNPVPSLRQSVLQIQKGQVEVVLGVTVDKSGRLADLMVIRSSGLDAYDREAMRTIRDSAPFAKPPAELLNGPNVLRMAWTFTVYL